MIVASVVLPRPGGPYRRTWSAASPLPLAAWSRTARFDLTSRWPMYSPRVRGRSELSTTTSASWRSAARIREASSIAAESTKPNPVSYRCSNALGPPALVAGPAAPMIAPMSLSAIAALSLLIGGSFGLWMFGSRFSRRYVELRGSLPPLMWMFTRTEDAELERWRRPAPALLPIYLVALVVYLLRP